MGESIELRRARPTPRSRQADGAPWRFPRESEESALEHHVLPAGQLAVEARARSSRSGAVLPITTARPSVG